MGGSKGGGTSQQTVQQELAPEQQELLKLVTPIAAQTLQQGVTLPQGPLTAPFTPRETEAQQAAVQAAQGPVAALNAQALGAQNFLLSGQAGTTANPALQDAINSATRPIVSNLTEQILPTIRGAAVTSGQLGGSRQGIAEGLAIQGAQRAIGETAAPIANEAFLRGLQAQAGALQLAPQTAQQLFTEANVLSAVGGQERQMQQALLSEGAQRQITEQLIQFELAKQVAGLAFGIPGGSTTATTVLPTGGGVSPVMGALGGAASGAAIGSMFGPGYGTAIGAGIGALAGLLGT